MWTADEDEESTVLGTLRFDVECQDLEDVDIFSKTDPVCVLQVKQSAMGINWDKMGETERIMNNICPTF